MGDSLDSPLPAAVAAAEVVQGSKSYMEVSISANKMSSRARSERKPDEVEEEEEGEELMSTRPLEGGGRRLSIISLVSDPWLSASETGTSSLAPSVLVQSLGWATVVG